MRSTITIIEQFKNFQAQPDSEGKELSEIDRSVKLVRVNTTDTIKQISGNLIFINFWEAWCQPCIAELNSIKNLQTNIKDSSVKFFIVSSDKKFYDSVQKISRQYNLPFFWLEDSLPPLFRGEIYPRTYIIHRNKVVYQGTGSRKWDNNFSIHLIDSLRRG